MTYYYYRNANKTAYWKLKNPISKQGLIQITKEEYDKRNEKENGTSI